MNIALVGSEMLTWLRNGAEYQSKACSSRGQDLQLETVSLQKTSVPAGAEMVHSHTHHRLLYIGYHAAARTYMDSLACAACVQMQITDRKKLSCL